MPGFADAADRPAGRGYRQLRAHELGQQRAAQRHVRHGEHAARGAELTVDAGATDPTSARPRATRPPTRPQRRTNMSAPTGDDTTAAPAAAPGRCPCTCTCCRPCASHGGGGGSDRDRGRTATSDRRARFSRRGRRQAELHGRQGSGARAGARLVRRHRARRARPRRRQLDGRDAPHLPRWPQARLLLLARVPDRPPAVRRAFESGPHRDRTRGAARPRRGPRPAAQGGARRRARQWRPRTARRLLHGEHGVARDSGARIRHPLRPRHLPAGDQGRLADGAAGGLAVRRQPVGVRAPGSHVHGQLRRECGDDRGRGRHAAFALGARGERQRRRVRHAAHRLARPARQYAAAVVGARVGPVAARRLQPRRPRRRARRPRPARVDLARALPQRRHRSRARAAPAAGILLRVRVAAGPAPPAPGAARRARIPCRPRGDPAQRHAPGHRRRGTDAAADRPPRHAVGTRMEHHDVGVQLHEPHAAARSAGNLAGVAHGATAAAPHADHLPHQRPAPRRAAHGRPR